ncbi:MAG: ribonuclease III [Candidatus Margulisiibacteriota bacterium]
MNELEHRLGVLFCNEALLAQALMHRSGVDSLAETPQDNERLEFLGDAILKLIVTEYLYFHYPLKNEGELSQLQAMLISDKLLSRKARELNLQQHLVIGENERQQNEHENDSLLANSLEAIFAACYLDQGLRCAKEVIHRLFQTVFEGTENLDFLTDYKTRLQEFSQACDGERPLYQVSREEGSDHEKQFTVVVTVSLNGQISQQTGTGRTKKVAEQEAARSLMKSLSQFSSEIEGS